MYIDERKEGVKLDRLPLKPYISSPCKSSSWIVTVPAKDERVLSKSRGHACTDTWPCCHHRQASSSREVV